MAAVRDNQERSRFELEEGGAVAFANYRREGGKLVIRYVEAPPVLRGTGAAGRLMQGVMEIARAEGASVVPLCSYAAIWIRRHKEWHGLLA
jgi:predicted GNAT family acetyltransferase